MQTYDENGAPIADTPQADIVNTVVATAEAAAQIIAAASPKAAAIVDVAIPAVTLLQQVIAMNKIGVVSDKALADLFADVGASVKANHAKWTG